MGGGLLGGIFGGGPKPPAPKKDNRPDETSEGISEARQRRRALAARTGRTGLRNAGVGEGTGRTGISIK